MRNFNCKDIILMVILITGASKGIGAELAKAMAAEECTLLLVARNETLLEEVADQCRKVNPASKTIPLALDLLDLPGQSAKWIQLISSHTDHLDVLVNNAGLLVNKRFESLTAREMEQMVHVNFLSPAWLTRELIPLLKSSESPRIVNVTSMGGIQGSEKFPGLSMYSSSKGGLNTLTECLAEELRDYPISVNALALGAVQTEMLKEAFPGVEAPVGPVQTAEFLRWFVREGYRFFQGKILPVSTTTP